LSRRRCVVVVVVVAVIVAAAALARSSVVVPPLLLLPPPLFCGASYQRLDGLHGMDGQTKVAPDGVDRDAARVDGRQFIKPASKSLVRGGG
jgi:hypothetical protein